MIRFLSFFSFLSVVLFISYCIVGTSHKVGEIKSEAPKVIGDRGWKIVRYDGYQHGRFAYHGGKVWYHVKDLNESDTYYRVFITKWGEELHFYYGQPEELHRLNVSGKDIKIGEYNELR